MSVLQRIELSFWHNVIPLIRRSKLIRISFQFLYIVFRKELLRSVVIPTALSAALGLMLGYLGGLISAILQ